MDPLDPQGSKETGNTKSVSKPRDAPCVLWFCTIPVTAISREELLSRLDKWCDKFRVQEELGGSGFQHFQGVLHLKKKSRMSGLKGWLVPEAHLEHCRDFESAVQYCGKEETRVAGPWQKGLPRERKPKKTVDEWRPWQAEVLRMAEEEPDERSIVWVVDKKGGSGKTTLARHICKTYNGICVGGKVGDVLYAATEGNFDVFCVNAARDTTEGFPYAALEQLKDGMWFSGKYESKGKMLDYNVHIFVFSNTYPDWGKYTADRWRVHEVIEGALVLQSASRP